MAFPTRTTPRWTEGDGGGSRAFSVNLPSTVNAGELLICVFSINDGPSDGVLPSSPTDSTSDAWSSLIGSHTLLNRTAIIWYKVADGDEDSGTLSGNWTGAFASSDWLGGVLRVQNWHGTTAPEGSSWQDEENDTTPEVPSLNPSGWDTEDTLWFAICVANQNSGSPSAPSGYTFNATQGQDWDEVGVGGSGSPAVFIASRELNAASESGGAWSDTEWVSGLDAITARLAIRPVAADPATAGGSLINRGLINQGLINSGLIK